MKNIKKIKSELQKDSIWDEEPNKRTDFANDKNGFTVSDRYFNISKTSDGEYDLELGNGSDAGWHWDGDTTDLVGFLIRMSNARTDKDKLNPYWDVLKQDALQQIDSGDWFYMISGDNVIWHFGQDGEAGSDTLRQLIEEDETLTDEQKEHIGDDFYYGYSGLEYSDFKNKHYDAYKEAVVSALQSSNSIDDFADGIESIKEQSVYDYMEAVDECVYEHYPEAVEYVKENYPEEEYDETLDPNYNPDYIGNMTPKPQEKDPNQLDMFARLRKIQKSIDEREINGWTVDDLKEAVDDMGKFDNIPFEQWETNEDTIIGNLYTLKR